MSNRFNRCPAKLGGWQCALEYAHDGSHVFPHGGSPTAAVDGVDIEPESTLRLLELLGEQLWQADRQRMKELLSRTFDSDGHRELGDQGGAGYW
ncbi:MAG: hypothetical protein AB1679_02485 [Actinomycetota bacterium]|jgi:hypothetical protein